jgi:hypothetical protein
MAKKKADNSINLAIGIYQIIRRHGIKNPVMSNVLEEQFSISGVDVRIIVGKLRDEGEPIGSNERGYYFANSLSELKPATRHLKSRALKMLARVRNMERGFGGEKETVFEGV